MPTRLGPHEIARNVLEKTAIDAGPKDLVAIIVDHIIQSARDADASSARELAESWERRVYSYLRRETDRLEQLGRPARICFNSSSEYMVQGACFVEPRDSDDLRDRKLRRSRSAQYYEAFAMLSPTDFELLCGRLLELLGVQDVRVTRRSADEGIDFYGRLALESTLFPRDLTPTLQRQLSIWLVGQAKHYRDARSGTPDLRDLMGAVTLARARAFSSGDMYNDMRIRAADPVFVILITTGRLSSSAWQLLDNSGIVGMDGEMVAAFLADREAGPCGNDFTPERFRAWVRDGGGTA